VISVAEALCIRQELAPQPPRHFQVEQHYLHYASAGAMRLEADGLAWSLPPARAALVAAGTPVQLHLRQKLSACSVLFATGFAPPPAALLSVFEMTPLARELVLECGRRANGLEPTSAYDRSLFRALQMITWQLAQTPSPAVMPIGSSPGVVRALALTEQHLSEDVRFEELATQAGQSPRTLARNMAAEIGMSWGQALQKMRMIRAIELLAETNAPITHIALGVGYQSLSAFNAAFRSFTGQTPTAYRRGFAQHR
jgi:AraC-like DNA-binding protein